jgi:hypothetical protein
VGYFNIEIGATGTSRAVNLYGGDSYDMARAKALRELPALLEAEVLTGVWNGTNSLGTSTATRTMQGLRTMIQSPANGTPVNSSVVDASFSANPHLYIGDAFQNMFNNGAATTETWGIIADAQYFRDISNMNDTKVQDSNQSELFKRVIRNYTGPFGQATVFLSRSLRTRELLIVPRERVRVLPLQGRNFDYLEMGADGRQHQGRARRRVRGRGLPHRRDGRASARRHRRKASTMGGGLNGSPSVSTLSEVSAWDIRSSHSLSEFCRVLASGTASRIFQSLQREFRDRFSRCSTSAIGCWSRTRRRSPAAEKTKKRKRRRPRRPRDLRLHRRQVPFTKAVRDGETSLGGSESACLGLARALAARARRAHLHDAARTDAEGLDPPGLSLAPGRHVPADEPVHRVGRRRRAALVRVLRAAPGLCAAAAALESGSARAGRDAGRRDVGRLGLDQFVYVSDYHRRSGKTSNRAQAGFGWVTKNGFDPAHLPASPHEGSEPHHPHLAAGARLKPLLGHVAGAQARSIRTRRCRSAATRRCTTRGRAAGRHLRAFDRAVEAVNAEVGGITYLGELNKAGSCIRRSAMRRSCGTRASRRSRRRPASRRSRRRPAGRRSSAR